MRTKLLPLPIYEKIEDFQVVRRKHIIERNVEVQKMH